MPFITCSGVNPYDSLRKRRISWFYKYQDVHLHSYCHLSCILVIISGIITMMMIMTIILIWQIQK